MTKLTRIATAATILLLMMSLPLPQQSLEENEFVSSVAQTSDMIADFSLNVASNTNIMSIDHIGQVYVLALSHDGSGSLGPYSWTGQPAGGALLTMAHDGTVVDLSLIHI